MLGRALAAKGYGLRRLAPLDCRTESDDARDVLVRMSDSLPRSVLVDVAMSRYRGAMGGSVNEGHPFVVCALANLMEEFSGSPLEAYYQDFQPITAAEVLGVSGKEAGSFAVLAPLAYLFPWQERDPDAQVIHRKKYLRAEALDYGVDLSSDEGFTHFGPSSRRKGQLELTRLKRVHESMSHRGYVRSDKSDITCWLLTDAHGAWCAMVRGGQHRIAVAAALGYSSVPCRIQSRPVKREEVDYWPQVVAGRISRTGALAVFDRVMRGNLPPVCRFDPAPFLLSHVRGPGLAPVLRPRWGA
jgi:hypothetical protein